MLWVYSSVGRKGPTGWNPLDRGGLFLHHQFRSFGRLAMASHEELTGALLDVRKAYRLSYLFQRRILDLVEQLSGMLGRRFWCWLPAGMDEAIRGGVSPSEKNAWKMLPLHNAEFFFLPPGAEPNASPREGQWLLELSITPDGGYTDGGRAEANPIEFTDPADCQSTIYLCAFIVKKDIWQLTGGPFTRVRTGLRTRME